MNFEEIWSYLMNFANRHYFWGELLKQRPCSSHWLHRREDWTLPPFFPDTIISPSKISLLLYRWIRLGKDFLRKRLQNGLLVSSQTSSFHKVFGSFKVLPGYLWIIKGHRLFCLDLKLSERVTAIKRTLCVNKWMKNTGDTKFST